jgi:hypothetical protein
MGRIQPRGFSPGMGVGMGIVKSAGRPAWQIKADCLFSKAGNPAMCFKM